MGLSPGTPGPERAISPLTIAVPEHIACMAEATTRGPSTPTRDTPAPAGTIGGMSEPRWLTQNEQRAWRAFLFAGLLVDDHLDRQLRRDAHMSHDYYGMLARLSEAPGLSLRMSDLAERTASSPSRLTHAVTNLEKLGWVARRAARPIGRVQFAVLTPAGTEALALAAPGHVEAVRHCLFDALERGTGRAARATSWPPSFVTSTPTSPSAPVWVSRPRSRPDRPQLRQAGADA